MKRKMKRIRTKVGYGVYTYGEYRLHACGSSYYNNRGYHIYKGEPLTTNYLATYSTLKDCEEYIDYDARKKRRNAKRLLELSVQPNNRNA